MRYEGSMRALLRRYKNAMKALLRRYAGAMKALLPAVLPAARVSGVYLCAKFVAPSYPQVLLSLSSSTLHASGLDLVP